uniref:Uncharacterized protein n=1 Tax=Opuntia streptacantha TaxID=393608 RepID=A0A7C9CKU5_OPUST
MPPPSSPSPPSSTPQPLGLNPRNAPSACRSSRTVNWVGFCPNAPTGSTLSASTPGSGPGPAARSAEPQFDLGRRFTLVDRVHRRTRDRFLGILLCRPRRSVAGSQRSWPELSWKW